MSSISYTEHCWKYYKYGSEGSCCNCCTRVLILCRPPSSQFKVAPTSSSYNLHECIGIHKAGSVDPSGHKFSRLV